ncbi:MAG: hypothetical protein AAB380_08970 [Verrucomicrobiota bacterium]
MAYLYHKNRSPYWYIQYLDSDRKKHDKSTGFRADDPNDTIKAKILRAELQAKASASGRFTNASFHHDSGESMKPSMATTPPATFRFQAMRRGILRERVGVESGKAKFKSDLELGPARIPVASSFS